MAQKISGAFLLFLFVLFAQPLWGAEGRYFIEGDGQLEILNVHNGLRLSGVYRNPDGTYNEVFFTQANKVFGVPVATLGEGVPVRLMAFVDYLQDKYAPGKTLKLLSGYRSPKHNTALRSKGRLAAKTSYHMEAMAADLIFPGVDSKAMWEFARGLHYGGVGYYDGKSVHLDAGKPRFWTSESALPKVDEPPQNRNIYLSVDKDIYKPGEPIHLFFSGISDYPFGLKKIMNVYSVSGKITSFEPHIQAKSIKGDCVLIESRQQARHIMGVVPSDWPKNKQLYVHVDFCDPTYDKMPKEGQSRLFEVR